MFRVLPVFTARNCAPIAPCLANNIPGVSGLRALDSNLPGIPGLCAVNNKTTRNSNVPGFSGHRVMHNKATRNNNVTGVPGHRVVHNKAIRNSARGVSVLPVEVANSAQVTVADIARLLTRFAITLQPPPYLSSISRNTNTTAWMFTLKKLLLLSKNSPLGETFQVPGI